MDEITRTGTDLTTLAPVLVVGYVAVALVGLLIGSFLNVVIHRVPRGESVAHPPSACPHCGVRIRPWDNVPVVSWLVLRGRGRCCGRPISPRYPLVEAATSLAFVGVVLWRGWSWTLPAWWWFAAVSIALALIDLDVKRLPDVLTLPTYPVAAVLLGGGLIADAATGVGTADAAQVRHVLLRAVLAAFAVGAWYAVLFVVAALIYGSGGLGLGDLKLSGVLGLYLGAVGWSAVLVGIFAAYLVGGVVSIALLATGRAKRRSKVPFGPYMLLGAWVGAVWGSTIADWYLSTAGL